MREWLPEQTALVGPTAVGKTAVGIRLAQRWNAEIVSADSMQVYRQMDIGTAKPTPDERQQAVFHAIDVADPDQEWTLADFQRLGSAACAEIAARGRLPLIVGGTGLYVRALTTQLDIPTAPPDEALRLRWRAFAEREGHAALQAEAAKIDPEAAARIHVNDIGRLIRVLEVHAATGRTMTELHRENQAAAQSQNVILFGLNFADRRLLYARIDERVDAMLAAGLLDEVRGLLQSGYSPMLKPLGSLGYRQMTAFLQGETGWDEAVATMKQETRRFARRQLIWFRGDPRIHWVMADGKITEQITDEIDILLHTILLERTKGTKQRNEQTTA